MFRLSLLTVFVLICSPAFNQTPIAVTQHPEATANGNQRKIVRNSEDNIFMVFLDMVEDTARIIGVSNTAEFTQWTDPHLICTGKNPSLVMCHDNENEWFGLVYENPQQQILYRHSWDFEEWSDPILLSDPVTDCRVPVADVDSSGSVNVLWINRQVQEHLIYAQINADTLTERFTIITADSICNVAIANHLQYFTNDLFLGIHIDPDTLRFYRSTDHLATMDLLFDTLGSSPCITYNSAIDGYPVNHTVRFMYLDEGTWDGIYEVQAHDYNFANVTLRDLFQGFYSSLCVDNILPDLGYSFIFIDETGTLNHAFSFGPFYQWCEIMETIQPSSGPISHPSIAYKHFNSLFVDFMWMEDNGTDYTIFHFRDEKQQGLGVDNPGKRGFRITGGPNPFSGTLELFIEPSSGASIPELVVFDSQGQPLRKLPAINTNSGFAASWDGTGADGHQVAPGVYLIRCTAGKRRTVKKVVYQP